MILVFKSLSNPSMTAITTIRAVTPMVTPTMESSVINAIIVCLGFDLK
jgi:hypothetical protein